MVIRPALPRDSAGIARLSSQLGYPLPPDQAGALQEPILGDPDHLVLIAEDEHGHVAGWVHAFIARRLFVPPFAELGGIVVDASRRRAGIASALLADAEKWASRTGCSILRIRSNILRAEAGPFYLGVGYTQSKRQNVFEKSLTQDRPA